MYLSIRSRVNYPLIFEIYAPLPLHCVPYTCLLVLDFYHKAWSKLKHNCVFEPTQILGFNIVTYVPNVSALHENYDFPYEWSLVQVECILFSGTDHVQSRERSV